MNEQLRRLMCVSEESLQELGHERLPALLQKASFAALFQLSREAASDEVRQRAAAALADRLRSNEDAADLSQPPANESSVPDELPAEWATHRHFYKYPENDRWILSTRSGVRVATFASEPELDRWWQGLKKQRGRILTRIRKEAPSRAE